MPLSIEEISDRLEIYDLYDRYAHAADDNDSDALDYIFLPHSTFDWSSTGGGKMTFAEARVGPVFTGKLFPWAFHATSNVRIRFLEGRTAAETKVKTINPSGLEGKNGEPLMFQTQGTYTDRLEKTPQGWKILARVWDEAWIVGPMKKVDGIPNMLQLAGKSMAL